MLLMTWLVLATKGEIMLNLERLWVRVAKLTNQFQRGLLTITEYKEEMEFLLIKLDSAIYAMQCPF